MNTMKEKIPLMVNGSLPRDEEKLLREALDNDPALESDYQFTKKLREGLREQTQEPPSDLVLAKIKKTIREEAKPKKELQSPWWKAGAIAACTVLMLQSFVMYQSNDGSLPGASDIQMLGENQNADFQLVFSEQASFGDIQALLQSVDANIVSGPSALGIIEIALNDKNDREDVSQVLAASNIIDEATLLDND